jgi:hypothetical protein
MSHVSARKNGVRRSKSSQNFISHSHNGDQRQLGKVPQGIERNSDGIFSMGSPEIRRRNVALTDVASFLGGGASSGLMVSAIAPAAPAIAILATAIGSFAAFLIGRRIESQAAASISIVKTHPRAKSQSSCDPSVDSNALGRSRTFAE